MNIPQVCLFLVPVLLCGAGNEFVSRNSLYRLQPSDVIEVHYRYTPEFDQDTVAVQPDGYASLHVVGNMKIADLTIEQARAQIAEAAGRRLLNPEVNVVLKEFQRPQFVVAGEVINPGKYDLRGSINTIEAIAMA